LKTSSKLELFGSQQLKKINRREGHKREYTCWVCEWGCKRWITIGLSVH